MNLEPPNLGIPLHRKSRFWLVFVAAVAAFGAISYLLAPDWGKSFLAAAALALPAVGLAILAPIARRRSSLAPTPVTVALLAVVVIYLVIAKRILLPLILERF